MSRKSSSGPHSWNHVKLGTKVSRHFTPKDITWSLAKVVPTKLPPQAVGQCSHCENVIAVVENVACHFTIGYDYKLQIDTGWKVNCSHHRDQVHVMANPEFPNLIYFSGNGGFPSVAIYDNKLWGIYGIKKPKIEGVPVKVTYLHQIEGDIEYLKEVNAKLASVFADWLTQKEQVS